MGNRFIEEAIDKLGRADRFEEFMDAVVDEALSEAETAALTTKVPTPGQFYEIQPRKGGLETTAGRAFGLRVGAERRQRAQEINDHPLNRGFWRPPRNAYERRYFADGIIDFNPNFTCGSEQRRAQRGERRCFAGMWIPREDVPTPVRPGKTIFLYDDELDWSNIGPDHLHYRSCPKRFPAVLPGDDDRVPVKHTTMPPYRWICKLLAVSLPSPGHPGRILGQATGFLFSHNRLATSAHVLYAISKDTGLDEIPDILVVVPGFGLHDLLEPFQIGERDITG